MVERDLCLLTASREIYLLTWRIMMAEYHAGYSLPPCAVRYLENFLLDPMRIQVAQACADYALCNDLVCGSMEIERDIVATRINGLITVIDVLVLRCAYATHALAGDRLYAIGMSDMSVIKALGAEIVDMCDAFFPDVSTGAEISSLCANIAPVVLVIAALIRVVGMGSDVAGCAVPVTTLQ